MIRDDTGHLDLIRDWFGPPWEMRPEDADAYFGWVCGMRSRRRDGAGGRAGGLLTAPGTAAPGRDLQPDGPRVRVPAG